MILSSVKNVEKQKLTEDEKHARLNALNEVVNEYSLKAHLAFENKVVEVLVEGVSAPDYPLQKKMRTRTLHRARPAS